MNRRKFTKTLALFGGASALTGLYSWQVEPHWLEFVKRKLPVKNLPDDLNGKTLMQISDIHTGRVDKDYILKSFDSARAYKPDIVVYTGDFISYDGGRQYEQLEEILKHRVTGRLGTVGILGNHDYGHNWSQADVADTVAAIINNSGITLLRNADHNIGGLNIIGIDDLWGTNFYPRAAMARYNAAGPAIVLCHNPDVCDLDFWKNYQGWILSGHTHGGQCKPPFLPPPVIPVKNKKYAAGVIDLEDGRMLYINRALGHSMQVRFNVRPEITVFEMVRSEPTKAG
ncbi:MAG: metallophosphoesterase [Niabella sp.]